MKQRPRVLISGGGTGGHIFPAISIADVCRKRFNAEILFVGAEGRMEMEKVPAAGYIIKALPIAGFNRKNLLKNIEVLFKLHKSLKLAKRIIKDFAPNIAIGVGGYASGPTLRAAQKAGIPTLLQEQNSYAGITNKLLASKAEKICVAYSRMERFFPAHKIVATGNPIRKDLLSFSLSPSEARKSLGLDPNKVTLLVMGGSLGALTINESMMMSFGPLAEAGLQIIWQTGKGFYKKAKHAVAQTKGVLVKDFLTDMATAYASASLVVARAGAGTISELQLLGKPCILVPSPNVAEDHQTKNAIALEREGAAILIPDSECRSRLTTEIHNLAFSPDHLASMSKALKGMALTDSDERIADEIEKILQNDR